MKKRDGRLTGRLAGQQRGSDIVKLPPVAMTATDGGTVGFLVTDIYCESSMGESLESV